MSHRALPVAAWLLAALAAVPVHAQCADGTPPPCLETAPRGMTVPVTKASTPSIAERARRFALLPFRNVTRRPEHDWLIDAAPLMLATSLRQFRDLTVIGADVSTATMARLGIANAQGMTADAQRRLAQASGGWTIVSGSVLFNGRTLQLAVEARDAATGRVTVQRDTTIDPSADVRPAMSSLVRSLLLPAGVPPANVGDLVDLTTSSLEAYRAYADAMGASRRQDYPQALTKLREAVKADSTFAMAWAMLGGMLSQDQAQVTNPASEANAAMSRAARYANRLTPTERWMVNAMRLFASGQVGQARSLVDSAYRQDSTNVLAASGVAAAEWGNTVLVDSLHPERGIRGNRNEALRIMARLVRLYPADPIGYQTLVNYWVDVAGEPGFEPTVGVFRREQMSAGAMLDARAPLRLVQVASDTLEFMTLAAWRRLAPDAQRTYRRRAAERAVDWAVRWTQMQPEAGEAWSTLSQTQIGVFDYAGAEASAKRAFALGRLSPFGRANAHFSLGRALLGQVRFADAATAMAAAIADSIPDVQRAFMYRLYLAALVGSKRWDDAWAAVGRAAPLQRRPADCNLMMALMVQPGGGSVPYPARRALTDTVARALPDLLDRPGIRTCALRLATGMLPDSASVRRPEVAALLRQRTDSMLATPTRTSDGRIGSMASTLFAIDTVLWKGLRTNPRFAELDDDITLSWMIDADSLIVAGDSITISWRWRVSRDFRWDLPGRWAGWALRTVVRVGAGADTATVSLQVSRPPGADSLVEKRGRFAALVPDAAFAGAFSDVLVPTMPPTAPRATQWRGQARAEGDRLILVVRGPLAEAFRKAQVTEANFSPSYCVGNVGGLCERQVRTILYR